MGKGLCPIFYRAATLEHELSVMADGLFLAWRQRSSSSLEAKELRLWAAARAAADALEHFTEEVRS